MAAPDRRTATGAIESGIYRPPQNHPRIHFVNGRWRCPDCKAVGVERDAVMEAPCSIQFPDYDWHIPSAEPPAVPVIGTLWLEEGRKTPWVVTEEEKFGTKTPDAYWVDPITGDVRDPTGVELPKGITQYERNVMTAKQHSSLYDISDGDLNLRSALVTARISILTDSIKKFLKIENRIRVSPMRSSVSSVGRNISIIVTTNYIENPFTE